MRLVEAFAILIHGDVLELRHIEAIADAMELVACDGVIVLLRLVVYGGYVLYPALIEPCYEELEASGIFVR